MPRTQDKGRNLHGRTNEAFPEIWLSLRIPSANPSEQVDVASVVELAFAANTVVDISVHPGLFGGFFRAASKEVHESARLLTQSRFDIERATDAKHAADLIQAHMIETLSAVGREHIDFYYLKVRCPLEEYQIEGALQAMEMARQEGHVRFLGLALESSSPLPFLGVWQFHDAFDSILLPNQPETEGLIRLAQERRVGVVTRHPVGKSELSEIEFSELAQLMPPVLVPVQDTGQIKRLLSYSPWGHPHE